MLLLGPRSNAGEFRRAVASRRPTCPKTQNPRPAKAERGFLKATGLRSAPNEQRGAFDSIRPDFGDLRLLGGALGRAGGLSGAAAATLRLDGTRGRLVFSALI